MSTTQSHPTRLAASRRRFDSLEQQAFLNLWRTYDRLRMHEDALFARFEVTPQQYNALRLLRGVHPTGLPTLRLAERLVSRAPDITRLVDKLEERSLVKRIRRDNNRRVVDVAITRRGIDLLDTMSDGIRACHFAQLGHLGADDLRKLIDLLEAARRPHEEPSSTWIEP